MARTPSNMVPLGTKATNFFLPDVTSGNKVNLYDQQGSLGTVIFFICNHCPFVKHINEGMVALGNDYIDKGFKFLAINSNDALSYPEDSPEKMKEVAMQHKFPFPYLYDESQEIAKSFDAACTPDFYVYDKNLLLIYRGQLDDSRPFNEIPVTGKDLRNALDSIISGKENLQQQIPSIGCNIKWKKNDIY